MRYGFARRGLRPTADNWLNHGNAPVKLDGTGATVLAAGQGGAQELALDATSVYWSNEVEGSINRTAKRGGAAVQIARTQQRPYGVHADASNVYWRVYREGAAKRAVR